MTSSTGERRDRLDGILDTLADQGHPVRRPDLVQLVVRSYGVSRKVAQEYISHLIDAGWAESVSGADVRITPDGRRHLRTAADWPATLPRRIRTPSPPLTPQATEGEGGQPNANNETG